MVAFDVVIPARYDSTRLPGKPLLDIAGKSLIQRVYDCATASHASRVVVATDDQRIVEAVEAFGGEAWITSPHHVSGTDRVAELVQQLKFDRHRIVVNLQGDEPLMPGALVDEVAATLAHDSRAVASTACCALRTAAEFHDPNVVKLVMNEHGHAMYFSRAPIPYPRFPGAATPPGYRHIGLYAYRVRDIVTFTGRPATTLELTEGLEQLRILHAGNCIAVCIAEQEPGEGVDTPEDLERVRARFGSHSPG